MADQPLGDYTPPGGAAIGMNFRDRPWPESLKFKYVTYHPPAGSAVGLDFGGAYASPPGSGVALAFTMDDEGPVVKPEQYLFPKGHDSAEFGAAEPRHAYRFVSPGGSSALVFGATVLRNASQGVFAGGIASGAVSFGAVVYSTRRIVSPTGLPAQQFGRPYIWNLRQYVLGRGPDSQQFGGAFLLGGVKYVLPAGLAAPALPQPLVVNTTANQSARPAGITPLPTGRPAVSPQTLFAYGFGGAVGVPFVQRNPSPAGWASDVYGRPTIRDKAHYVNTAGAGDLLAVGFPRIFDPKRLLQHSSRLNVTTVFGDTRLRLQNQFVRVQGFDSAELSTWAIASNQNRYLLVPGMPAAGAGAGTIYNLSPNLSPGGIASLVFGQHNVGARIRQVRAPGVAAPINAVGAPSLWQTPSMRPAGIVAPAMPSPTVWPRVRNIEAAGKDAALFGAASVWFSYRTLSPAGLDALNAKSTARLEHGLRTIDGRGFSLEQYDRPWVSYGLRELAPASGTEAPKWVSVPMVGGLRFLRPDGFDAARFGTRVIPEVQALYPLGFSNAIGVPAVRNRTAFLLARGFATHPQPADRWGRAKAWNLRQYVALNYDAASGLAPPAWPQWTAIANRTRVLGMVGTNMARVGAPDVTNNAAAILPAGVSAPSRPAYYLAGSVTHRLRPLPLQGIEHPYIPGWARISNNAVPVRPLGASQAQYGLPALANINRTISGAGRIAQTGYGYPFVSPRVRGLSFEGRYAIQPPAIPLPKVELLTRYVEPLGTERGAGVGLASLSIHLRVIRPTWIARDYFGWPVLRNVTPEVIGRGWNSEDFGATAVRLEWRPFPLDGFNAALFGGARIADRRLWIAPPGTSYLAMGDKLRVTKEGGRPEQQNITVVYGIEPPPNERGQVSEPTLNQQVLYVKEPLAQTRFGTAVVTSNNIRIEYGISEMFLSGHAVTLRVRQVFPKVIDATMAPGTPRLSPHTVYAVTEAPAQAKANHPGVNNHLVDYYEKWYEGPSGRYAIGKPRVENQHRRVTASGRTQGTYGAPKIVNKAVTVEPGGFNMMRLGLPAVPGPQDVGPYDNYVGPLWGKPTVARGTYLGPQTIACKGWVAGASTPPWAALWTRNVLAKGSDSMAMGKSLPGDTPYMWQGLRIGPLVPVTPRGDAMDLFGATAISLRVRGIEMTGADHSAIGYTLQEFSKRMRVRYAVSDAPQVQRITTAGHRSSACGWHEARPMRHYIRPDGNSDQHRKGAIQ